MHDPHATPRPTAERPGPLHGVSAGLLAASLVLLAWSALRGFVAPSAQVTDPEATARRVAERSPLLPDELATVELFERASPSVVHITNFDLARSAWSRRVTEYPRGSGSGFVWDEDGYVVTNYHVVHEARRLQVRLNDGSMWDAEVVGAQPNFDLAVLKVDAPSEKLQPLPVGASGDLRVGQKVFAIGNPFGLDQTLTTGVISGLDRTIQSMLRREIQGVIQTDAAINPGNSGGPLLDSAGRLIGINTAIYSPSGASAGIGFAVPVDTVNLVVPQLVRHGRLSPPGVLGVNLANGRYNVRGAVVGDVVEGSGAARAGLRPMRQLPNGTIEADVIVAIDGRKVEQNLDVLEALALKQPGEVVRVQFLREGELREAQVELQSR